MKKRQPSYRLEGCEAVYYICGDYALCVADRYQDIGRETVKARRLREKVTPHGLVKYFRFRGELVEVEEW